MLTADSIYEQRSGAQLASKLVRTISIRFLLVVWPIQKQESSNFDRSPPPHNLTNITTYHNIKSRDKKIVEI